MSERDPQAVDQAAAHLLQRAIAAEDYDRYTTFVDLVTDRPPTELNDLLEWSPIGPPIPPSARLPPAIDLPIPPSAIDL